MIFLVLAVLGGATYAGYTMSKKYLERERFFLEARLLCDRLAAEIRFSHSTLAQAFYSAAAEYKSGLKTMAEKFADLLQEYSDTGEQSLRENIGQGCLKGREYDLMIQFFGSLGRADTESELKTISGFKGAIEGFYEDAAAEKRRYGGLYTKLGFLTGLVISILIV